MYFAPFGVGAAMAYTVGHMGIGDSVAAWQIAAHQLRSLSHFYSGRPRADSGGCWCSVEAIPYSYRGACQIAFATSTSEAALPKAIESMEQFGVPREIVAFVIPAGYSFNMDGSSLYLSLASVFVAQAAGIHMSWRQQLSMVFTLMLTSKGLAGVPRAVLVVLLAAAASFHLPTEPIFVLLGIDALIDMGRTALNVIGNCLACAVVARSEGELDNSIGSLQL